MMETYLNIKFLNLFFILTSKYFYRKASVSLFLFIPFHYTDTQVYEAHHIAFLFEKKN